MTEVLENLKKAVIEYDDEAAARWARKAVEEGIDPIEALDALTEGVKQVGDGFGRGNLWLPDLVGAASAMTSATEFAEMIGADGYRPTAPGAISLFRELVSAK